MLKLKQKLSYAIDLGVDFLVRAIKKDALINDETDFTSHCLATLCVAEFGKNANINASLAQISKSAYSQDDNLFIVEKGNSPNSLNAIAALSFLMGNKTTWGVRFLNGVAKSQQKNGFIRPFYDLGQEGDGHLGHCICAFLKGYELTNDKTWLHKAQLACSWIINNVNSLNNYWELLAFHRMKEHSSEDVIDIIYNTKTVDLEFYIYNPDYKRFMNKIKVMAYTRLDQQVLPPQKDLAGAFLDEEGKVRLDWSYKNLTSFKKILEVI